MRVPRRQSIIDRLARVSRPRLPVVATPLGGTSAPAVGCQVRLTADEGVPNATTKAIPWDADEGNGCYDDGGCWSAGNPTRLTAPEDGVYLIWVSVRWKSLTNANCDMWISLNGTSSNRFGNKGADSASIEGQALSVTAKLEAGDYVEIRVYHEKTGAEKFIYADAWGSNGRASRAGMVRIA